jgi:hypothetical protein
MGKHVVFLLGGGKEHVGAVSVCEPGAEPSTISLDGHKEAVVTEPLAKAAAKKLFTTVVVVGGIHIDDASKAEIREIVRNCKKLETML